MNGVLSHPFFLAAAAGHGEQLATIFFAQVLLLIAVGRLLGEWMQRIRQPAVIGQLLAGIILGPSVFGAIWPACQQAIYPPNSSDRQMLNAVSEIGVLLLLPLTGMETDLALVKRDNSGGLLAVWSGSGSGYCQRLRGHDHRLEYFRSASGK